MTAAQRSTFAFLASICGGGFLGGVVAALTGFDGWGMAVSSLAGSAVAWYILALRTEDAETNVLYITAATLLLSTSFAVPAGAAGWLLTKWLVQ